MTNAPFLVPCLVVLRAEFDAVAPHRDRGADGWIGDTAHASGSSDHNPDETGNTPYEDADDVDEVHAVDIDSTGPWPDGGGGGAGGWFDRTIRAIAARERVDYESATVKGRLRNIIWRGQIISRSWGWTEWRTYDGASAHYDHAHFSALYTSDTEADRRPWGVVPPVIHEGEDVTDDDIKAIAAAVWGFKIQDPYDANNPDRALPAGTWLKYSTSRGQVTGIDNTVKAIRTGVDSLVQAFGGTDEQLIQILRSGLGDDRLRAVAGKILNP